MMTIDDLSRELWEKQLRPAWGQPWQQLSPRLKDQVRDRAKAILEYLEDQGEWRSVRDRGVTIRLEKQ